MTALGRRHLLQAAVGVVALTACADEPPQTGAQPDHGSRQPGVTHPEQQAFGKVCVLDSIGASGQQVGELLGAEIDRLAAGRVPEVPEPGDLTVTVGFAEDGLALPVFARDALDPRYSGGDVVLQVCASDPAAVLAASDHLTSFSGRLRERWSQLGFVGGRNLLGFHDGTVQPRGERELGASVWDEDSSTVMVVRRIELDVERFTRLPVEQQEAVIGRRRRTGEPLSGGGLDSPLDLAAKSPTGAYLIPATAHVRRAHPLATGRPMMLRRGYSYADGDTRGLLFISFQRDVGAFVQTQYRLDAADALSAFSRVTASGVFRVPPRRRA